MLLGCGGANCVLLEKQEASHTRHLAIAKNIYKVKKMLFGEDTGKVFGL